MSSLKALAVRKSKDSILADLIHRKKLSITVLRKE